jgi:hypothetical protein
MSDYFDQTKKRSAEFIKPNQSLKLAIGHGGLDTAILEQAQKVIDDNTIDFMPIATRQLSALQECIKIAKTQKNKHDTNSLIAIIVNPAMQLKANGGMFGYPIVTKISGLLIHFMEVVNDLDDNVFDLLNGFVTSLNAVIIGGIRNGDSGGDQLFNAINDACQRYLNKV